MEKCLVDSGHGAILDGRLGGHQRMETASRRKIKEKCKGNILGRNLYMFLLKRQKSPFKATYMLSTFRVWLLIKYGCAVSCVWSEGIAKAPLRRPAVG